MIKTAFHSLANEISRILISTTFEQNKPTSFYFYAKMILKKVVLAGHNHEFVTKHNQKNSRVIAPLIKKNLATASNRIYSYTDLRVAARVATKSHII